MPPALPAQLAHLDADDGADPAALERRIIQPHRIDVAEVAAQIEVAGAGAGTHQRAGADVLVAAVAEADVNIAHLDRAAEDANPHLVIARRAWHAE